MALTGHHDRLSALWARFLYTLRRRRHIESPDKATSSHTKRRQASRASADSFRPIFRTIREVPETGLSCVENARIKATGYATQAKVLTLADDSGLEIDALGGAPGVFSARYLGESVSFPERIESLLARLSGIEPLKRTARFVCAIAIADHEGNILNTSIGTCEGRIAGAPHGSGGFGYDPIFIPQGYNDTFAELDPHVKNRISHRARALEAMRGYLQT